MKRVALVFLVLSLVHALSFRQALAGSPWFFGYLGAAYLVLAVVALHYFWDEGTLLDRLAPRWGDLSIGFLSATVLLFASWRTWWRVRWEWHEAWDTCWDQQ